MRATTLLVAAGLAIGSEAFAPTTSRALRRPLAMRATPPTEQHSFDPFNFAESPAWGVESGAGLESQGLVSPSTVAGLGLAAMMAMPEEAMAKGGEYGLAEGRIISMAHPIIMGGCFLVSLGAGYTGFQWRRIREIGTEVTVLKAELKPHKLKLEAEMAKEGEEQNLTELNKLKADVATFTAEIDAKSDERKELVSKDFRDRHWALGSLLLGVGISFAIEGPVNTYMRAGKLFPGPHLYAGAGCVAMWALAAALVPQMQKGKDWARSGHIGLNALSTAMFAYYQIPTGIGIAQKVIEKTKFP